MKIINRICLGFILLSSVSLGQEKAADAALGEPVWTQLYAAWIQGSEPALREFVRNHKSEVTRELIMEIASRGRKERADAGLSEARLSIALAAAQEIGDGSTEADVLYQTGEYHRVTGKTDKALACFDRALQRFESAGDLSGQGKVLLGRGKVLDQTGKRAEAMTLYDKALPWFEKAEDLVGQGNVYSSQANLLRMTGKIPQAFEMYDKALPLYEKADDAQGQGQVYLGRGVLAFYQGNSAQAAEMYRKALPYLEKAGALMEQGHLFRRLGEVYFRSGDYAQAMELYDKAGAIYEQAQNLPDQGTTCMLRGDIYFVTGDTMLARAMYEKALPLFQRANQFLSQAHYYRSMGNTYWKTGQFAQALAMYDKALPVYEEANAPDGQANVYMGRADVYLSTGNYPQALAMYEKALPLYEKASHPIGQGVVYMNRGLVYARTGDRANALAMYEKALPFAEKTKGLETQGNLHSCRGRVYAEEGDDTQALACFEKARSFYEKVNVAIGLGGVNYSLGRLHVRQGRDAEALACFEKALGYYTRCQSLGDLAGTLVSIAGVHARAGQDEQALAKYEHALDLFEQVRRNTGIEELKLSFMGMKLSFYETATAFMLEKGYGERAFRAVERMKARLFLDRLAEGLVDLEKGIDPELRTRRDALESKCSALGKRRIDLHSAKLKEEERTQQIGKLSAEIERAERELSDVKAGIRLQNPLYASVQYPEAPTVDEMRSRVLRKGEVLIEYFLTRREAWCFVLSPQTFDVVRLPGTPAEIAAAAAELIDRAGSDDVGVARAADSAAARLHRLLIAPLNGRIARKSLIIVPDGVLARLPFEMLEVKSGRSTKTLIQSHPIRYVQSAAVLAFYRTQYKREGTSDRFAGFGDPVYDHESYTEQRAERGVTVSGGGLDAARARRGLEEAGVVLGRLPGTGKEVKAIGALFEKRKREGTTFLRLEASEEHAKGRGLSGYGYLHFAAHGLLDDDFQAIALSQVPGAGEDGFLTLGEIMNLHWDARLVVLSACETGLGKIQRGEGVTGLTRAVMYAGSPAAVVSLWSVSDLGTKELMARFYGKMISGGLPPTDALRRAKLEMAADPKWQSPYYWAAFVLYGE